jgi:hypothetical protein
VTTIQHLEGADWGEPEPNDSFLVRRCTQLRRKPLGEFTVEDLRIMLGQEIAVPILLPLALDVLVENPLAAGDFYPGDLLGYVVKLPTSAWAGRAVERQRFSVALAAVDLTEAELPQDVQVAVIAFRETAG